LAGLSLSLVGGGASWEFIVRAFARVVFSLLAALVASLAHAAIYPAPALWAPAGVGTGLAAGEGYASAPETDRSWLGKSGTAHTPLRPAGIADFDGERVDVVSDGEFIDSGSPIAVVRVDGNRIVVRQQRTSTERG
jgi:membrane-bound serine protease (ClpP class)